MRTGPLPSWIIIDGREQVAGIRDINLLLRLPVDQRDQFWSAGMADCASISSRNSSTRIPACLNRHLEPPADEEMMIWFEGEMDEGPVQRLGDYRPAGVGHLSWGSTRSHILCD